MTQGRTVLEPSRRRAAGLAAEAATEAFLSGKGLIPVDRNHVVPGGEVDLVMRDGDTVVFVEVRLRAQGVDAALGSISRSKTRRVIRAATHWLSCRSSELGLVDPGIRFDVVAVAPDGRGGHRFLHIPAAFDASDEA